MAIKRHLYSSYDFSSKTWTLGMMLCALLASLFLAGCGKGKPPTPPMQEFVVRGRVESVDTARKRAVISHQDIDGYMKAMTMSFAVPDEQALNQLRSGDQIEGRLMKDNWNNLTWLESIRRLDQSPATSPTP
ncbi:MAG: hypothetical protein EBU88_01500 [Acidobacteria bacterium]|nr:hypothetical protein [Acidobacteriota bacterium]